MAEATRAVVIVASVGLGVISSVAGSSGQSAWALLNQFQLVLMLPFLKSFLTAEFIFFIRDFEFALFNFSFLDFFDLPVVNQDEDTLHYIQPDSIYEENNIESGSFLINQVNLLKSLIITFIIHMIILLISKI